MTTDKEYSDVVLAVPTRPYQKVAFHTFRSDHEAINRRLKMSDTHRMLAWWYQRPSEYKFDIVHAQVPHFKPWCTLENAGRKKQQKHQTTTQQYVAWCRKPSRLRIILKRNRENNLQKTTVYSRNTLFFAWRTYSRESTPLWSQNSTSRTRTWSSEPEQPSRNGASQQLYSDSQNGCLHSTQNG